MQFHFRIPQYATQIVSTIVFASSDSIFELDFNTGRVKIVYRFNERLNKQPEFFLFDDEQICAVIASQEDCLYVDLRTQQEQDMDKLYNISNIKEIIYDHEDKMFYLLANKHYGKIGFFMIRFNEDDPLDHSYIMKIKDNLDIGDANLYLYRNKQ